MELVLTEDELWALVERQKVVKLIRGGTVSITVEGDAPEDDEEIPN